MDIRDIPQEVVALATTDAIADNYYSGVDITVEDGFDLAVLHLIDEFTVDHIGQAVGQQLKTDNGLVWRQDATLAWASTLAEQLGQRLLDILDEREDEG